MWVAAQRRKMGNFGAPITGWGMLKLQRFAQAESANPSLICL
jgi:hypothetical protein